LKQNASTDQGMHYSVITQSMVLADVFEHTV